LPFDLQSRGGGGVGAKNAELPFQGVGRTFGRIRVAPSSGLADLSDEIRRFFEEIVHQIDEQLFVVECGIHSNLPVDGVRLRRG
jgi:hypothetical protein